MSILKTASEYRRRGPGNRGFTLLEIMVSVSVIAIVFVSLFRLQSGSIGMAAAGRFSTLAPILADRLLTEIRQNPADWTDPEGDFGDAFPGYRWTCDLTDVVPEDPDLIREERTHRLKRIALVITGPSDRDNFQLVTWRVIFD